MLTPSAFLASAAATLSLQSTILPESLHDAENPTVSFALASWKTFTHNVEPVDGIRHIQRAWDTPVARSAYEELHTSCDTPADKSRLKAAEAPHAGCATTNRDWPTWLRLSDEAIRVAVGFRLGFIACQPHVCICGAMVDARGLHGLSCRKSGPRHIKHSQFNDLIWRVVKRANSSHQRANWSLTIRWKEARRSISHSMETWIAPCMGRHRSRYICRISHWRNS